MDYSIAQAKTLAGQLRETESWDGLGSYFQTLVAKALMFDFAVEQADGERLAQLYIDVLGQLEGGA